MKLVIKTIQISNQRKSTLPGEYFFVRGPHLVDGLLRTYHVYRQTDLTISDCRQTDQKPKARVDLVNLLTTLPEPQFLDRI